MTVESLRAGAHEDFVQERIQKISPSLLVSLRTPNTPFMVSTYQGLRKHCTTEIPHPPRTRKATNRRVTPTRPAHCFQHVSTCIGTLLAIRDGDQECQCDVQLEVPQHPISPQQFLTGGFMLGQRRSIAFVSQNLSQLFFPFTTMCFCH